MAVIEIAKIQVRRGQELQTGIPQLDAGEFGFAQDTEHLYIGKRISEGATTDDNTRILTENDLNYFQTLLVNNTSTAASTYRYRQSTFLYTTTTSIQSKLDSLRPSLIDFGVIPSTSTYVQIDSELQNAINELYVNIDPTTRNERRRILEIPAGSFYLSNTITLPPFTKLVGAGPGLTKIRFQNSATSMFKTVDIAGNTFETGNMALTTGSCRDILIEAMTLAFSSSLTNATSLISIDNVVNARIVDCNFETEFDSESTTTFGIVSYGIGVNIRGQGDNGTEKCKNILIDGCQFNGLYIGVYGTGTVITPSVKNSVFGNLNRGIMFESLDTIQGPSNGFIAYNRFQDILQEGIYVGNNPNNKASSHLSTQNYFARVGGLNLNEFTTSSSVTSVIQFLSIGNKTVDDYFARRAYFELLSDFTGVYYNPYVRGSTTIADSAVYTKTINVPVGGFLSSNTVFTNVPLNGGNQSIAINYQLTSTNQSRSGVITANIDSSGNISMTDTYNYTDTLKEYLTGITTSTGSTINLLVVSTSTYPEFSTVQSSIGNWYMTGDAYSGKAAYITSVVTSGSFYLVTTDSASPAFDFGSAGTYTLLTVYNVDIVADYSNNLANSKNFVSFYMNNPSTETNFIMNYQVDIQT